MLDVTTRTGEALVRSMPTSRSFQLPSGRRASQMTTEILESLRCRKARSQSGECRTAIGKAPPFRMPERAAERVSDGETSRTVPVAAFVLVQRKDEGESHRRGIPPCGRGFSRHEDLSVRCGFFCFWGGEFHAAHD